jgi:Tetracyclin repressor-like, C-terminal domain
MVDVMAGSSSSSCGNWAEPRAGRGGRSFDPLHLPALVRHDPQPRDRTGELAPEVDQELLLDLLLGPLWFRLLVAGAPITPDQARTVVELVLDGALDRGAKHATGLTAKRSR